MSCSLAGPYRWALDLGSDSPRHYDFGEFGARRRESIQAIYAAINEAGDVLESDEQREAVAEEARVAFRHNVHVYSEEGRRIPTGARTLDHLMRLSCLCSQAQRSSPCSDSVRGRRPWAREDGRRLWAQPHAFECVRARRGHASESGKLDSCKKPMGTMYTYSRSCVQSCSWRTGARRRAGPGSRLEHP